MIRDLHGLNVSERKVSSRRSSKQKGPSWNIRKIVTEWIEGGGEL